MMRTTMLAATWGILLLFGADHAFAEHLSSSFLKFCEAENVNGAGASTADGPTEPVRPKKLNPSLTAPQRTWRYPNDCSS